jgi:predicted PurR-regulated permease PerM
MPIKVFLFSAAASAILAFAFLTLSIASTLVRAIFLAFSVNPFFSKRV